MLEEQICNLQTQNEIKEQEDNVEGTVKAKDQIIEKVTKEKAQLQQEMNKLVRILFWETYDTKKNYCHDLFFTGVACVHLSHFKRNRK